MAYGIPSNFGHSTFKDIPKSKKDVSFWFIVKAKIDLIKFYSKAILSLLVENNLEFFFVYARS